MKFSILIAAVPSRVWTVYPRLINHLEMQTQGRDDVEILALLDNKKRSVGAKRNALLSIANGEYLAFIDDDDMVAADYVESIMNALYANPTADCVVFDCVTTVNNKPYVYSKYSVSYGGYRQEGNQWWGLPAHTMVWKSNIAKKHMYKDLNYEEDVRWVKEACVDIKNEVRIDKVLYFYFYNSEKTETLRRLV